MGRTGPACLDAVDVREDEGRDVDAGVEAPHPVAAARSSHVTYQSRSRASAVARVALCTSKGHFVGFELQNFSDVERELFPRYAKTKAEPR